MYSPQSVATVDGKMVVSEYDNNRVLIYNNIPSDGSALPDVVVGQPDFVTRQRADCAADFAGAPPKPRPSPRAAS